MKVLKKTWKVSLIHVYIWCLPVSESLKAEMAAAIVERDDMRQELESSKRGNREQLREYQQVSSSQY